jgi:hypothetical protein
MGVDWDYCEICKQTYPDCGDNPVHRIRIDDNEREICEDCFPPDTFGTLYYDESDPWYLARIPVTIDSKNCWSVDCTQIKIFRRYETESKIPNDVDLCREECESASDYIGKIGKKATTKLIKAIQAALEDEKLSADKTYTVYAMSLRLEDLTHFLTKQGNVNVPRICLSTDPEVALDELIDGRRGGELYSYRYVTLSPSLRASQRAFHVWTEKKRVADAAQKEADAAKADFLAECDWSTEKKIARILSNTAQFPTPVIAIILQFADEDSALFFDVALHRTLLQGRKRKRLS